MDLLFLAFVPLDQQAEQRAPAKPKRFRQAVPITFCV
jgi:hypothetical protein